MTELEALETYAEMEDIFGDDLPNFEHHPKQFEYYVKLYRYYHERKRTENSDSDI